MHRLAVHARLSASRALLRPGLFQQPNRHASPFAWPRRKPSLTTMRPPPMPHDDNYPSPQRCLFESLDAMHLDKWGWVIYRCTYGDDEAWARFKAIITSEASEDIADSDTPQLADKLEWTFVDDQSTLDGASTQQLRARFQAWAAAAVSTEQPRYRDSIIRGIPRYNYFIQVDAESLRSVTRDADPDDDPGHVNFVQADWKSLRQTHPDEEPDPDDVYEPIEGCTEEDVGWMKLASRLVGSEYYEAMGGPSHLWYAFYKRPPELQDW